MASNTDPELCSYIFEPDQWERKNGHPTPLSETWECPHECYSEEEFCLFHLDIENRNDINENDVRREFISTINKAGRQNKEFVGASIPQLDLRSVSISSVDTYPIRFMGCDIGDILISESELNHSVSFISCILGNLLANNCVFRNGSDFTILHTTVSGITDIQDSDFSDLFFRDSDFMSDIKGRYASFDEVHFFDSTIEGGLEFPWVVCSGRFHITGCSLDGAADFSEAIFKRDTRFRSSRFKQDVDFGGSSFSDVIFTGSRFESRVKFTHASFSDSANFSSYQKRTVLTNVDFSGADFEDDVRFQDVLFCGSIQFKRTNFDESSTFSGSRFYNATSFAGAQFSGSTDFSDIISFGKFGFESTTADSVVSFNDSEFKSDTKFQNSHISRLLMTDSKFHKNPNFNRSDIDNILLKLVPVENQIVISFVYANIGGGSIIHPAEKYALFDLTRTTLGDVELVAEGVDNVFEPFQFIETTFDNFDFKRYRTDLEEINWNLDDPSVDEDRLPDEVYSTNDIQQEKAEDDISELVFAERIENSYPDVSRPSEYLETTYQKAKNGAKQVGDSISASEFLIREMRSRRNRYKSDLFVSMPILAVISKHHSLSKIVELTQYDHHPTKSITPTLRWIANKVYDVTSGYGEKPANVVIWSIHIVLLGMIIYPMNRLGGIKQNVNGEVTQYAYNFNLSTLEPSSLIETLRVSLYFSLVNFTTLGSRYYVDSWASELIVAIQSFSGAFFIALFVYSLGKQFSR